MQLGDDNCPKEDNISKLAYFDTIDEKKYKKMRESGSVGVTVPIEGVPFQFSGDYKKAQDTMNQLKRLMNINYTTEHHRAIYSNVLSQAGLEAYKSCVANRGIGTSLWRSRDALTAQKFFMGVKWNGGAVAGVSGKFDFIGDTPFQVHGGKVIGVYATKPPKDIRNGQELTVEVERVLTENFRFAVSINGYTDRLELPAYNPQKITFVVKNSPVNGANSDHSNGFTDMNLALEFLAGPNEEFLPATAVKAGEVLGAPHSEFTIELVEPKRIFYRLRAYAASKCCGGFAKGHVSVIAATWTP